MIRATVVVVLVGIVLAGCADPCSPEAYGGVANEETWRSVRDAFGQAKSDDTKSPRLVEPANEQGFSGPPSRFSWTSPLSSTPAQGPKVTGQLFLLEVGKLEDACRFRVLTTEMRFESDEALKSRVGPGGEFVVKVMSALVEEDQVVTGPFQPVAIPTFTVTP